MVAEVFLPISHWICTDYSVTVAYLIKTKKYLTMKIFFKFLLTNRKNFELLLIRILRKGIIFSAKNWIKIRIGVIIFICNWTGVINLGITRTSILLYFEDLKVSMEMK